ncbi:DUF3341 domain-containing protein [Rhodohalobacter mucosus]|uniref:DUF3341 domain-containing protein n=1 Tax=Rhodohalobacter mucosus TaxID=2079485 RepID=A0A316U2D2_9BACT|nr:DUF3341 domain-containing protein [Rhodohalobacter mucosus]PWN07346.1 DUF3341 domain-containing protein [Rhodohalobacter mucosus]
MSQQITNNNLYGVLAEFKTPKELMDAARLVNQNGYRHYDTFSPYPIHGMDRAMSLKKSKLGWIVLSHGLLGFSGALAMIYWMMVVDYPLNISGKTLMNVPAWIPVTFELTVLLSAFGAVFGMFFLNGLPKLNHPLFNSENFKKVTDDGFFVCIESEDPQFESEKVQKLLQDAGAATIEEIYED